VSVGELFRLRAKRLSDEALGLAPPHFDLMVFLSALLLFGFSLGTVASAQSHGVPSGIAQILFCGIVVCYVLLYEMAYDLNRSWDGVYQCRRSPAAVHFLQIKRLISQDEDLRDTVDFELAIEENDTDKNERAEETDSRKSRRWYDSYFD